jgi:hypothetical protein
MKRLSLICFLSACAVLAEGCSNSAGVNTNTGTGGRGGDTGGAGNSIATGGSAGKAGPGSGGQGEGGASGSVGTGGKGGMAGSGSAGKTGGGGTGSGGSAGRGAGGANGGVSGTGSICPGVQPLSGTQCRTNSDCPSYMCTSDPNSVSVCSTNCATPPPQHGCTVDTDCPTGHVCISSTPPCCNMISTACELACTATSCSATQRCNAAGHCEVFPCSDGFTCPTTTICSPSATGADANGCAPEPCTAGYTCATGFQCASGIAGADAHGCAPLPCSQTGCPTNFVCKTTATSGGCTAKTCSADGDCDCGYCIQGFCADRLNACVMLAE